MGFNDIRKKTRRIILIYDTANRQVQSVQVPVIRDFLSFQGTPDKIIELAKEAKHNLKGILKPAFARAILTDYPDVPIQALIEYIREKQPSNIRFIDFKIQPKTVNAQLNNENLRSLKETSVLDIFKQFIESQDHLSDKEKQQLIETYIELIQEIKQ
jgi:16S rRNA C967 or C1407 C5-methylase (RsmB/RsmF family)